MPTTPNTSPADMASEEWRDRANCAGIASEHYFPPIGRGGYRHAPANAICAGCEVRRPCLDDALTEERTYAIWAGLPPSAISALRQVLDTTRHKRETVLDLAARRHQTLDTVARLVPIRDVSRDDHLADYNGNAWRIRDKIDEGDRITLTVRRHEPYDYAQPITLSIRADATVWRFKQRLQPARRPPRFGDSA